MYPNWMAGGFAVWRTTLKTGDLASLRSLSLPPLSYSLGGLDYEIAQFSKEFDLPYNTIASAFCEAIANEHNRAARLSAN